MRFVFVGGVLFLASCGDLLPVTTHDAGSDGANDDVAVAEASIDAGSADADVEDVVKDVGADVSEGGLEITALAINQNSIIDIAVDSTNVYWTSGTSVSACAINGCAQQPTVLVNGSTGTNEIATDGVNVYFEATAGGVQSCSVSGCNNAPTMLSEGGLGLATDGVDVFFGDQVHPGLAECDVTGCASPPPRLIFGGSYNAFAVDTTSVYWTNRTTGSEIWRCAKAGCNGAGTLLADGQGGVDDPYGIATDGTNVYWTSTANDTIQSCAVTGCNNSPTTLATKQNGAVDIATDGSFVYWVEQGAGTVRKCAVSGCGNSPTIVTSSLSVPTAIAVDATSIYVAVTGAIVKVAPK